MKKISKLIVIILCLFICAGCIDMNVKMNINNDKSVDFNINLAMDMLKMVKLSLTEEQISTINCQNSCPYDEESTEYTNCLNTCLVNSDTNNLTDSELKKFLKENLTEEDMNFDDVIDEEDKKEMEDKGYTVTSNFDQDNFVYTVSISKHFDNIDEITTTDDVQVDLNEYLNSDEKMYLFTKTPNNTYKSNLKIDPQDIAEENENDLIDTIDVDDLDELVTYNYEINLPVKAITENATSKSNDDKTLTWDLTKNNEINFEFAFPSNVSNNKTFIDNFLDNMSNDNKRILSYSLIGGGIFVLIITTILFVKSSKKQK